MRPYESDRFLEPPGLSVLTRWLGTTGPRMQGGNTKAAVCLVVSRDIGAERHHSKYFSKSLDNFASASMKSDLASEGKMSLTTRQQSYLFEYGASSSTLK